MDPDASGTDAHLAIGEVLTQLREEFPDITISKIRFLESQGLIDPERTPSGYRRFYPEDLVRLRWILEQQRDKFLPLRVIKERLDEGAHLVPRAQPAPEPEPAQPADAEAPQRRPRRPRRPRAPKLPLDDVLSEVEADTEAMPPRRRRAPEPTVETAEPPEPEETGGRGGGLPELLTRKELAAAAGVTEDVVAELESFALVTAAVTVPEAYFDRDDVVIVQAAGAFGGYGIEARHLKTYEHAADREATLFVQALGHYLRLRNPEALHRFESDVLELTKLGGRLRAALVLRALRTTLEP